jgi:hypothetical protein
MDQTPLSPNESCGYFWPVKQGGHTFTNNSSDETINKETSLHHIEAKNTWQAMQQAAIIKATLVKQSLNSVIQTQMKTNDYDQINPWYFWWIFVICASLIWLERKFD